MVRELHEELGIRIQVGVVLGKAAEGPIRLTLYAATSTDAEPRPLQDHDELRWLSAEELESVRWLPIDAELLPAVAQLLAQLG